MTIYHLHLDSNFCGVNEDIYIECDNEPDSNELEAYANDWIGLSWDIEEIETVEEVEELGYEIENWD